MSRVQVFVTRENLRRENFTPQWPDMTQIRLVGSSKDLCISMMLKKKKNLPTCFFVAGQNWPGAISPVKFTLLFIYLFIFYKLGG